IEPGLRPGLARIRETTEETTAALRLDAEHVHLVRRDRLQRIKGVVADLRLIQGTLNEPRGFGCVARGLRGAGLDQRGAYGSRSSRRRGDARPAGIQPGGNLGLILADIGRHDPLIGIGLAVELALCLDELRLLRGRRPRQCRTATRPTHARGVEAVEESTELVEVLLTDGIELVIV